MVTTASSAEVKSVFWQRFGKEPQLFISPGRINIIGEHTDYNDGFVLPAAIDKHISIAICKNGDAEKCRFWALNIEEYLEFSLSEIAPVQEPLWANYLLGVTGEIRKMGFELAGFDCVFAGNIPLGAGLSSSAALESAFAFSLNATFQLGLDRLTLALIGQRAEHHYVGVKCGRAMTIMLCKRAGKWNQLC